MTRKKDVEDTSKDEEQEAIDQEVSASDVLVSPAPEDQTLLPQEVVLQRKPELMDHVRYVSENATLHAIVQAAFTDDTVDLYVEDPTNVQGRFHVSHAGYDAGKSIGTFHFPED